MKLTTAIATRVKNLLEERGVSQYYLYKTGGVPRSTVSDIINEKKNRVSTATIFQICSTVGITLKEFFDDKIFDEVDD